MALKKSPLVEALQTQVVKPLCSCGRDASVRIEGKNVCLQCYTAQPFRDAEATMAKYGLERKEGESVQAWGRRCREWYLAKVKTIGG